MLRFRLVDRNNHVAPLSTSDFGEHLQPAHVRVMQAVFIALAGGVTIFTIVVAVLAAVFESSNPYPAPLDLLRILTVLVLATSMATVPLSRMLHTRMLDPNRLRRQMEIGNQLTSVDVRVERAAGAIRTAEILRVVLLEGAALFGLVVCVLGVMMGVLEIHPVYWINLFPSVFFLLVVATSFPTTDRVEQLFRDHLLGHL